MKSSGSWAYTSKTEHNEVAPAQHEMAPVFTIVNVVADHNQLTMEVMKRVADKHDLTLPPARETLRGHQRLGQA